MILTNCEVAGFGTLRTRLPWGALLRDGVDMSASLWAFSVFPSSRFQAYQSGVCDPRYVSFLA